MKRPKTRLKCTKCGYRWKEVVYTSSVLVNPPLCPKCAKKGVRGVGKPVKVLPLRKRVKNLAKAILVKPVYYGALVPLKYTVLKPSLLGLKAGWWSLKMKLFLASLPFRAAWWGVALPFRVVNRLLAPPPKVIYLGGEDQRTGFLDTSSDGLGDWEDEDDESYCPECGYGPFESKCEECGFGGEPGFAPEDTGRTGFAAETASRREEPTFGASRREEPTFGASRREEPTFGASCREEPTFGASRREEPTFGARA